MGLNTDSVPFSASYGGKSKKNFQTSLQNAKKKLGLGLGFGFVLRGRHEKMQRVRLGLGLGLGLGFGFILRGRHVKVRGKVRVRG